MGKISRLEAQMYRMSAVMEQVLQGLVKQDPKNNGAGSNGGTSIDKSQLDSFVENLIGNLQDRGFLPKKPLFQRNADNGDAAPTLDETPASVKGPVSVIYGLRKLKEKIAAANFVIEKLPDFDAVAAQAGKDVPKDALNNSWNPKQVATVMDEYRKLVEVVKELKSLMAPLTLQI